MSTHAYNAGKLYENGEPQTLLVYPSQEVKIQASGSGSYRVYGRLTSDGAAKPLKLINASTYDTADIGEDDNIYICEVAGLHSIFADEVVGVEEIYARAFAST